MKRHQKLFIIYYFFKGRKQLHDIFKWLLIFFISHKNAKFLLNLQINLRMLKVLLVKIINKPIIENFYILFYFKIFY